MCRRCGQQNSMNVQKTRYCRTLNGLGRSPSSRSPSTMLNRMVLGETKAWTVKQLANLESGLETFSTEAKWRKLLFGRNVSLLAYIVLCPG